MKMNDVPCVRHIRNRVTPNEHRSRLDVLVTGCNAVFVPIRGQFVRVFGLKMINGMTTILFDSYLYFNNIHTIWTRIISFWDKPYSPSYCIPRSNCPVNLQPPFREWRCDDQPATNKIPIIGKWWRYNFRLDCCYLMIIPQSARWQTHAECL